jgi:hypothetical protein
LGEPGEEAGFTESSAAKYENREPGILLEKVINHLPAQKQQVFRMIHQEGLTRRKKGVCSFKFTVTDAEGDVMTRSVNVVSGISFADSK